MSDEMKAADLPIGTVLTNGRSAWTKTTESPCRTPWRGTHGGYYTNRWIDERLAEGVRVLRAGTGEG